VPAPRELVIARLQEQARTQGPLPPLLAFYQHLAALQVEVGHCIRVPIAVPAPPVARASADAGRPLITDTDLAVDWALLRQTYQRVVALFANHAPLFGTLPAAITSLTPGRVINRRTLRAWWRGRGIVLPVPVADTQQPLLRGVFHAAITPFLTRHAAAVAAAMDVDTWRRGYCPACGGNPDFAYLHRETTARWLVCSRCDTPWVYQRLQCPYCANQDQNKLAFFTDEPGRYRLYVCDACHRYLKAVDLRQAPAEPLFALERLLTLDLDQQAQARGYRPAA